MKDVIITIKGDQEYDGDGTDMEFVTEGEYRFENGKAIFNYPESELTGLEGTVTTVEADKSTVAISRKGAVAMNMLFEEGRKHYFMYNTQLGAMSIGVETSCVSSVFDEHGGELELKYFMNMENTQLSRNSLFINVKEA
ncbi:MAG: DUF1934 domain-containing protein [Oscillospiraceae bacterium]|nr:DUF1934 domain-containing protein [Oscillospiraceae bacterium]